MIVLIFLAVLIVVGIILSFSESIGWGEVGFITATITTIVLCLTLIVLGLYHLDINGEVMEFRSVGSTVEQSREAIDIESAALQLKITEQNQWLASRQYYNSIYFIELFVPDKVCDLKPIE